MSKIKNFKRGFTLIELLVVIAIIGILAAIVLSNLGAARDRARDASAQSSMSSTRAQAELGTNNQGTYIDDLCTTAGTTAGGLDDLISSAEDNTGNTAACGQDTADGARPNSWGAAIDLNNADVYCVDSTGFAGVTTGGVGFNAAAEITDGYSSADVLCNGS